MKDNPNKIHDKTERFTSSFIPVDWPGRIFHYSVLPSTNTFLSEGLRAGQFRDYDGVWTEYQNAGRGRKTRKWITPSPEEGRALTFSIAIPLQEIGQESATLLQVAAWTWVMLIKEMPLVARLKWPNDILVGGKKLSGFLAETIILEEKTYMILGMGVNLMFTPAFLARIEMEVGVKVTFLDRCIKESDTPREKIEEMGRLLDPRIALGEFLKKFYPFMKLWEEEGFIPFVESWKRESDFIGRWVTIAVDNEFKRKVLVEDIGGDGCLMIKDGDERKTIFFGEIKDMD